MALAVAFASCDDPITRKERSLIDRQYKEGVLTASQSFDFTRWIDVSKGAYRLPAISADEDGLHDALLFAYGLSRRATGGEWSRSWRHHPLD